MANETERCVDILIERSNEIDKILDSDTKHDTNELIEIIQDTQNHIRDNKSLIPSYILKKINHSLNKLEQHLDQNKKKLNFKFSSSSAITSNVNQEKTVEKPIHVQEKFFGLKDRIGEELTLSCEEVDSHDINLINLTECHVNINGLTDTVHMKDLKNVTVDLLVAKRAITVTNCVDCKFKLACQQLRINLSKECEFNVYTIAGSMLEGSNKLIFKELKSSELPGSIFGAKNNWKSINDFDWLSSQNSENFTIIE